MRPSFLAPAVGLGGVVLLLAVGAARLGATTRGDVVVLCEAERRSGTPMRRSMASVSEWIRDHLATPEEQLFFSSLRDAPLAERGERLRRHARAAKVQSCPLADTYDELAGEALYREDMQALCSYVTFPGFAELDPEERVAALEAWTRERAASPRTRALVEALGQATGAEDRVRAIRQAAAEIDVVTCDLAGLLGRPADLSCTVR
jgi:hypothetical protein